MAQTNDIPVSPITSTYRVAHYMGGHRGVAARYLYGYIFGWSGSIYLDTTTFGGYASLDTLSYHTPQRGGGRSDFASLAYAFASGDDICRCDVGTSSHDVLLLGVVVND